FLSLLFLLCCVLHRRLPAFPTRRSSDLDGLDTGHVGAALESMQRPLQAIAKRARQFVLAPVEEPVDLPDMGLGFGAEDLQQQRIDRKSTRLNSSHVKISYAVFCLKKKKK